MNAKDPSTYGFKARLMIVAGVFTICAMIIAGGFYFIAAEKFAEVELSVYQYSLSSNSIGVSMIFIAGAVALIFGVKAFGSLQERRFPGGTGGTAEVIGSGEACGGKGGHSGSFGPGGKGGDARVVGKGKALGGEGGDG